MPFWTEAGQGPKAGFCTGAIVIGQHRQTWSTTEFHLIAAVKQVRNQRDANERNSQNIVINVDVEERYDNPMNLRTAAASLFIVMRWFHVSVK